MNNMEIRSNIKLISLITETEKKEMFQLMKEFYDNVDGQIFIRDLLDKDYCIMLYNEENIVKGFSTGKEIHVEVDGKLIKGIFSGDTIIHKDYWGRMDLYKEFARNFVKSGSEEYYWFLISKGYKTYKMLPLFFKEFYPNYKVSTPLDEKKIMDAFGLSMYPMDYNKETGVNEYKSIKDKLKEGVADITEKQLKDMDIKFFIEENPGYIYGNDLVCLAKLNQENLRKTAERLFRGV
jgi:hypothetical protein